MPKLNRRDFPATTMVWPAILFLAWFKQRSAHATAARQRRTPPLRSSWAPGHCVEPGGEGDAGADGRIVHHWGCGAGGQTEVF